MTKAEEQHRIKTPDFVLKGQAKTVVSSRGRKHTKQTVAHVPRLEPPVKSLHSRPL